MNRNTKWIIVAVVLAVIALLTLSSGLVARPTPSPQASPSTLAVASTIPTLLASASPEPSPSPQDSPSGQAKITWSVPQLSATMFPGTQMTTTVSFQSDQNLASTTVWVTPSLDGILSATPASFTSIVANQTYQLTVNLAAPPEFQKRSFGGTIHIRNTDGPPRTYATPLTVNLQTDFLLLTDSCIGVSLAYPSSFYTDHLKTDSACSAVELRSSQKPLLLAGGALSPGTSEDDFASGYEMIITSSVYDTTTFSVVQWLRDTAPGDTLESSAPYNANGVAAYVVVFTGEIGAGRPMIIIPRNGRVYTIGYQSTYDPASPSDAAGLQTFYSVARSIQFTN
jgi:hypothetical protein